MVTLLLTFFVLLWSMVAEVDERKVNMIVQAATGNAKDKIVIVGIGADEEIIEGANHGDPDKVVPVEDITLDDILQQLQKYIQEKQIEDSVQVTKGEGYIFIRFMDNMFFEPNSARLKAADLEILNFVGYGIKSVQNQLEIIRIDGHTAAIPENPDYPVSDRDLSSERANRVLRYFEENIGITPEKMLQMGFGKYVPIADNNNPVERSKNRRVEIYISTQNELGDQLNNIYEKLIE